MMSPHADSPSMSRGRASLLSAAGSVFVSLTGGVN